MAAFPYVAADNLPTSLMPRLSLTLSIGETSVDVVGLLDTGAAINVLPYQIGLALGASWSEQTTVVPLAGSMRETEARALVVTASNPSITPDESVRLVFAWTRSDAAPLILGQMNFFLEFDVCFYRSLAVFEVRRKEQA